MFGLGHMELLLILLAVVFIFGAKRLPDIGKALGRVQSEFKEGKESVLGKGPPEAKSASDQDREGAEGDQPARSEESGLERELKDQLVSRLPGVGRLNRLKKAAEVVGRVAKGTQDQDKT